VTPGNTLQSRSGFAKQSLGRAGGYRARDW
jgi:hypothetical protein